MFLSRDDLKLTYGVDMEIGKTYVDRPVPEGNLYWKGRKLYMTPHPGYVFMPVFADLAYRLGIPKEQLLSPQFFELAEHIMHSAGKLEAQEINWEQHVKECIELAGAVSVNAHWLDDLRDYFEGRPVTSGLEFGNMFPSLNRADAYLFSLCIIPFDRSTAKELLHAWYALINYYLILDDLEDVRKDFEKQEENAFLDAGLTDEGIERIYEMINQCHDHMLRVNPVMANRIDHKRSIINIREIIQSFRKEQPPVGNHAPGK